MSTAQPPNAQLPRGVARMPTSSLSVLTDVLELIFTLVVHAEFQYSCAWLYVAHDLRCVPIHDRPGYKIICWCFIALVFDVECRYVTSTVLSTPQG